MSGPIICYHQLEVPYVTKELAMRPTRPTAAPPTAVILQPRMSVKTLTMGEQKKIIPMESEPTHAARDKEAEVQTACKDNKKFKERKLKKKQSQIWVF